MLPFPLPCQEHIRSPPGTNCHQPDSPGPLHHPQHKLYSYRSSNTARSQSLSRSLPGSRPSCFRLLHNPHLRCRSSSTILLHGSNVHIRIPYHNVHPHIQRLRRTQYWSRRRKQVTVSPPRSQATTKGRVEAWRTHTKTTRVRSLVDHTLCLDCINH